MARNQNQQNFVINQGVSLNKQRHQMSNLNWSNTRNNSYAPYNDNDDSQDAFQAPIQKGKNIYEGFNGTIGDTTAVTTKNIADYAELERDRADLNAKISAYSNAYKGLETKSLEYLNSQDNTTRRNYNVFVNRNSNPGNIASERVGCYQKGSSGTSTFKPLDTIIPLDSINYPTSMVIDEESARNACKLLAIDYGKSNYAITKDQAKPNIYNCHIGSGSTDNIIDAGFYTKTYMAGNALLESQDANVAGLFLNGQFGMYNNEGAVQTENICNISTMEKPIIFGNFNMSPWNGTWGGISSFTDKTAKWVWSTPGAPSGAASDNGGANGFYYYSYNNTSTTNKTIRIECAADNYVSIKLNGNSIAANRAGYVNINGLLVPGVNIFEFAPGNNSGPASLIAVIIDTSVTPAMPLFKTGDDGWGVRKTACNISSDERNALAINQVPEGYASCDRWIGGAINANSINASYGVNCRPAYPTNVEMVQYVRVVNKNTYLQIAQIAVFAYDVNGISKNVALLANNAARTTTASDIWEAASNKEKPIDGFLQARNHPNIYHSRLPSAGQFWELNLGKEYPVYQVDYYNRAGCCYDRSDYTVTLLGGNRAVKKSFTLVPNVMKQQLII